MRVGEIRVGKGVAVRLRQPCGFQRGSYGTALVRGARIRATRRAVSVVVVWELSDETCGTCNSRRSPSALLSTGHEITTGSAAPHKCRSHDSAKVC